MVIFYFFLLYSIFLFVKSCSVYHQTNVDLSSFNAYLKIYSALCRSLCGKNAVSWQLHIKEHYFKGNSTKKTIVSDITCLLLLLESEACGN